MHALSSWFADLLGLGIRPDDLGANQMIFRTLVVLPCTLLMARIAGRRFLGGNAAFDVVLAIVLGSVVSRAINGQAAFWPTLVAGFALVLFHRLLGVAACHSHWASILIKGRDELVVRDGRVNRDALRRADFTEDDLLENLRLHGNVGSIDEVAEARLERNGRISVVPKKP